MVLRGWKDKRPAAAVMLGLPILLAGCGLGGGSAENGGEKTALKVMYYDERSFYSQMGLVYSAVHPEVDITVVTNNRTGPVDPKKDMEAEFKAFVEREEPDILMLTPDQLTEFGADGKLMELDAITEEKDYRRETLIPGLLDYMKELGGGKLYGLPTSFYSQALFYNKDLFAKYGIEPPQDKMTWDKLFELARRFPTDGAKDKRVYGLSLGYNGDAYQLGSMIGSSQNLSVVNASSKQVTIDTPAWKKTFQTAMDGLKSGALYTEDPNAMNGSGQSYEDYLLRDPFIAGRAAMKMESAYFISQIKEAQTRVKDKAIANWDLVTMPVNPEMPDSSTNMSFNQIFAVNAKSVNAEAAKEFIRYLTGEEYARVVSKVQDGGFPVRTTYLKDDDGHNMKAFYGLKPVKSSMYKDFDKLPQAFFSPFMTLVQQELKDAEDGKKSLAEALANAQTQGQQLLQEAENKQKEGGAEGQVDKEAISAAAGNSK